MAVHPLEQMCPCPVLQEEPLDPSFLGSMPQKVHLGLECIPYPDAPTGSLGRRGGPVGPLSPR